MSASAREAARIAALETRVSELVAKLEELQEVVAGLRRRATETARVKA
jgi:uncharacterized coiled-coil protein SlyX